MERQKQYEIAHLQEKTYKMKITLDPFNRRIRVDEYMGNIMDILHKVKELASVHDYEKCIVIARQEHVSQLMEQGYVLEVIAPGYFRGNDAYFMATFRKDERRSSEYWVKEDQIVERILDEYEPKEKVVPATYKIRKAKLEDAAELAMLFSTVFPIYPVPLHNPAYVREEMEHGAVFYVYEQHGKIVSVAAAEINNEQGNAEMTNCATLEEHRKHGLMRELLRALEEDLRRRGIFCAYTIARSLSFGMNAVFYGLEYTYRGRLTKNCYIYDKLEDMNVWVKDLSTIST